MSYSSHTYTHIHIYIYIYIYTYIHIHTQEFGCPETDTPYPAEDFSCRDLIWQSLMNQTLDRPIGVQYVYSDLRYVYCTVLYRIVLYESDTGQTHWCTVCLL